MEAQSVLNFVITPVDLTEQLRDQEKLRSNPDCLRKVREMALSQYIGKRITLILVYGCPKPNSAITQIEGELASLNSTCEGISDPNAEIRYARLNMVLYQDESGKVIQRQQFYSVCLDDIKGWK